MKTKKRETTPEIANHNIKSNENFLFANCSIEWYPIIDIHKHEVKVNAGDEIFSEGSLVTGVYIIDVGKVKVVSNRNEKSERILRLASDGMILGHRGFANKIYPVSAVALTDVNLTFIPYDIFIKLVRANADLSIYLLDFLSHELHEAEERMHNLLVQDIRQRVACIIIKLIDVFGYDKEDKLRLSFTISRKDFSNMAGTTYETIIRTLAFLEKKKYIQLVGKTVRVVNENNLRKFASGQIN